MGKEYIPNTLWENFIISPFWNRHPCLGGFFSQGPAFVICEKNNTKFSAAGFISVCPPLSWRAGFRSAMRPRPRRENTAQQESRRHARSHMKTVSHTKRIRTLTLNTDKMLQVCRTFPAKIQQKVFKSEADDLCRLMKGTGMHELPKL